MKTRTTDMIPLALALALALAALLAVPAVHAQQVAPAEPSLTVKRYVVEGPLPLSAAEAAAVLQPFTGEHKTLRDIESAAQALEQRLRVRGQAFHRVFVPAQRPADGEIRLQVVQFTLGQVEVAGNQHFGTDNIRASLPTLREGQSPDVEAVGTNVAASNANPAKQVTVTFRESRQPNTVDAAVRVNDADPIAFVTSATSNQRLRGDGPAGNVHRVSAAFQHSNLFNLDHVLTLSYTTDPDRASKVRLFGAFYQVPLYSLGMTASAYYTSSDINSGRVPLGASYLDVSGSGTFWGLRLAKPLPRIGTMRPTLAMALDQRVFNNSTTTESGQRLGTDVGSRALSLQAGLRDDGEWGAWSASIERAANIGGGPGNTVASHADNGNGERGWQTWRYNADLVLPAGRWQMSTRVKGQETNQRLIPGEQFGLGGALSVRGFSDRVVAGDRGLQWNLEALGPGMFGTELRPLVFADGGWVASHSGGPREKLAAAGAGVRWQRSGLQVALDLAKVLDDRSGATGTKPVRLSLAVQKRF